MSKRIIKRIGWLLLIGLAVSISVGAYLWFKPHRNVQATKAFAEMKVSELINQFSSDAKGANEKYLAPDGNSKVLIVEGLVSDISTNQSGETVILLKEEKAKVGVSASFTIETSLHMKEVKKGDLIKIKGAITAGNSYDADLDLYEHAVLIQCDIIR
jgi:hypothetical protein